MNKKDFYTGLISGILIAVFLGACVICAKLIYDSKNEDTTREHSRRQVAEAISNHDSDDEDEEDENPDSENPDVTGSGNNVETILSDEAFLDKVMLLEDMIDMYFVDDVDDEDIKNGVYNGIMESLNDPYAAYYTPEELYELTNDTQGVFYGIGVMIQTDQEVLYPKVTQIIEGGSAADSDIRVEDYIVEVDGVDVYDMDLTDVVALIKGPEGTEVTLDLIRPSTGEEFEVTLKRVQVENTTVNYEMLENNIAYIQIQEFDVVTVQQFKDAMDTAYDEGMESLILDLRGNPGGSLAAVVEIADYMLPKGTVVYTEDKYGETEVYSSSGRHEITVPMVVLVNGGSASAAEILAGAIKDYGVGTLLGTTTYGKGIVQRIIPLDDGSAIKLTVSHYYTPLGNDIHKVGIEPDIVLEFDIDAYLEDINADNQLDEAIEILSEEK